MSLLHEYTGAPGCPHVLQTCECAHGCAGLLSRLSLCCSVRCCHLLFDRKTVGLSQSHVGHQHSSGTSVDELIFSSASKSSSRSLALSLFRSLYYSAMCHREEEGEDLFRLECDDDSCHGLFAMFIKHVGICLVGVRVKDRGTVW